LKENRPRAFEDFEAIAEDLFKRKITSPEHLGIEGRSNGGLLVGATMTRRPDLYGAVICGAPLLDMKRYHKLLAGASWMAEYGDPDIPEQWQYISKYSPYQNLKIFLYLNTRRPCSPWPRQKDGSTHGRTGPGGLVLRKHGRRPRWFQYQ